MGRPRHTKKDTTHKDIVQGCRELGMIVWDTADIGGEILDLMIFWRGRAVPVEIKTPGKIRLTEKEEIGIKKLRDVGVEPIIATNIEDILKAFE